MVLLALGLIASSMALEMPKVIFVQLDEATAEYFDEPPSPVDYAAFFDFMKASEPRCLAAVDLLQWPGVEPTLMNGLVTKTRDLELVFAVMLDNDASDPSFIDSLAAFPKELTVKGGGELAPFKSVATKLDSALIADKMIGFTRIDFGQDTRVAEGSIEVPLLASGPEEAYAFSLPLVLAGQALKVAWGDVSITLGDVLEFGGEAKPIPLGAGGSLSVPGAAPETLLRVSGARFLDDLPVADAQDAVLIVGSDRERDRVFALPNGSQVSRGELVARAVHFLLSHATAPDPVPEPVMPPEPVTVAEPVVVEAVPEVSPVSVYRFPDLRAPNIGLWILGIASGLALGCLLLYGGRNRKKTKKVESDVPKPLEEPSLETPSLETPKQSAERSAKKEAVSSGSKPKVAEVASTTEPPKETEPVPETNGDEPETKPKDVAAKSSLPPDRRKKRSARKKRPRSKRRRPS